MLNFPAITLILCWSMGFRVTLRWVEFDWYGYEPGCVWLVWVERERFGTQSEPAEPFTLAESNQVSRVKASLPQAQAKLYIPSPAEPFSLP